MEECTHTTNPFARVLYFYELYIRSKLVPGDLDKIARKYSGNAQKLISDLQQKYSYPIPDRVNLQHIAKLCHMYGVSSIFKKLAGVQTVVYDARFDVYSADFDPLLSLKWNKISVSHLNAPTLDNTTKLISLIPGRLSGGDPSPPVPSISAAKSGAKSSASASISADMLAPKSKHLFDVIAENSLTPKRRRSGVEVEATASPLALLNTCMQNHVRVRIVVRRNHGVRGSLDAYIRAFDRHFNMLLSDVDEEYITNAQKHRAIVQGHFRSQNNVKHRHLSQLLLRGDLVVLVFRKPA